MHRRTRWRRRVVPDKDRHDARRQRFSRAVPRVQPGN
jgi:hypothetical protein